MGRGGAGTVGGGGEETIIHYLNKKIGKIKITEISYFAYFKKFGLPGN